jgi:hypothetical protein
MSSLKWIQYSLPKTLLAKAVGTVLRLRIVQACLASYENPISRKKVSMNPNANLLSQAANPEASLEEFVSSQNTEHRVDQSENMAGTSGWVEMADLSLEPGIWWR